MRKADSDFVKVHVGGGYSDQTIDGTTKALARRPAVPPLTSTLKHKSMSDALRKMHHTSFGSNLQSFKKHEFLMSQWRSLTSSSAPESKINQLTDHDILQQNYRFVMTEDPEKLARSWEQRMAWKYYTRLFKEYALADLSRYTEGKIGLRWRTEAEVVSGKGQFSCGNKRCDEKQELRSYELNFKYKEAGEVKNELVKVRVCLPCARRLFHRKIVELRKASGTSKEAAEQQVLRGRLSKNVPQQTFPSESSREDIQHEQNKSDHHQRKRKMSKKERKKEKKRSKKNKSAQYDLMDELENQILIEHEQKAKEEERHKQEENLWSGPLKKEKTRDDDMDDYFNDLFM